MKRPCSRCGAPGQWNSYCDATPECRWYGAQDRSSMNLRFRSHYPDGSPRYPSWVEYSAGMPLVLKPQMAKTVSELMLLTGASFDEVWYAFIRLAEELT